MAISARKSLSRAQSIAVLALLFSLLLAFVFLRPPPLAPVVPHDLAALEPRLKIYIEAKIAAVQNSPRSADSHAALGLVYAANSLWREAHLSFSNAFSLDRQQPLALLYTGVSAQEMGSLDQAIQIYRQTTQRFPEFAQGFYRLGDALLRQGGLDEAQTAFQRLTELAPQEWRGFAGLGDICRRRQQFPEAANLLEKALQIEPNAKEAHYMLGLVYRSLGQPEKAERELWLGRNASTFPMPDPWAVEAPQHMRLLQDELEMAREFLQSNQPVKAIQVMEKTRFFHPNNLGVLNNLAAAYNAAGDPAKAQTLAKTILAADPKNLSATITLALSSISLGLLNEALEHANRAIALAPESAQSYVAKANVLLAQERDEEALAALQTAARIDNQNAALLLEMADLTRLNLGRLEDAFSYYQQAIKADPLLAPAYHRAFEIALQLGKPDAARSLLKQMHQFFPDAQGLDLFEKRLQDRHAP